MDRFTSLLSYLPLSRSTSPLSYADTSDCLLSYPYLPITPSPIVPDTYLVAPRLSLYQWLYAYLVRYIDSQSGGTVGLGLCPLHLVTLLARVLQQYIRMYL